METKSEYLYRYVLSIRGGMTTVPPEGVKPVYRIRPTQGLIIYVPSAHT